MDFTGIKKAIIDIVKAFKPIQINPSINIKEWNGPIQIGGKQYNAQDGQLVIGEGQDERIPLTLDSEGYIKLKLKEIEVEGLSDKKSENLLSLDTDGKIFTRADLTPDQLEFLTTTEDHEKIIKELRPILKDHMGGTDLGALLACSAVIRHEDSGHLTYPDVIKFRMKLLGGHFHRGAMLYNLFRSNLLRTEVLEYLANLQRAYSDAETVRMHFLTHWDSILTEGYPTAIFISTKDTETTFAANMEWRIKKGFRKIYIYSRIASRNRRILEWCKTYAKEKACVLKEIASYQLGPTPALKLRLTVK